MDCNTLLAVVDDDEDVRVALTRLVSSAGFRGRDLCVRRGVPALGRAPRTGLCCARSAHARHEWLRRSRLARVSHMRRCRWWLSRGTTPRNHGRGRHSWAQRPICASRSMTKPCWRRLAPPSVVIRFELGRKDDDFTISVPNFGAVDRSRLVPGNGLGAAGHRHPGFARRDDHPEGQPASPARSGIRWRDQGKGHESKALVGASRRAAEACAQRVADHDGRQRLWRAGHLRGRRADAGAGPHRKERGALHELPLHLAVLADTRGADHRAQPPCGRLRRGGGNRHGFPGLRLGHPQGKRHPRRDPEGQRVRDLVVRQEPQHAVLPGHASRPLRPVAQRHGLRVFLRFHGWRRQPVAAEPVPQHHRHLSV